MEKQETMSVEELYIKEKKKSQILMATTALFSVLFFGTLLFGGGTSETAPQNAQGVAGQQAGGRGQRGGGLGIANFFSEDGSINQEAITQNEERSAQFGGDTSQFASRLEPQIETAVESGEITGEQAIELKAALGL